MSKKPEQWMITKALRNVADRLTVDTPDPLDHVEWRIDKKGRPYIFWRRDVGPRGAQFRHLAYAMIWHTQRDTWRVMASTMRHDLDGKKNPVHYFFVLKRVWGSTDRDTTTTAEYAYSIGVEPEDAYLATLLCKQQGTKNQKLIWCDKYPDTGVRPLSEYTWWALELEEWGTKQFHPNVPQQPEKEDDSFSIF